MSGLVRGGGRAGGRRGEARDGSVSSRVVLRRSVGAPILFTVVYSSLASAIYFSLGVIAGHALGLTPLVFLVAALLFTLTAMTYVEGATLHPDRGGATVFARYAFNELVSFIAGWAVLLDYVILIAVTAYFGDPVPAGLLAPAGEPRRGSRARSGDHRPSSCSATSAALEGRRAGAWACWLSAICSFRHSWW